MARRKSSRGTRKGQRSPVDPIRPRLTILSGAKGRKRRKQNPVAKAARKQAKSLFRSAVATLKRKGLLPKSVDARKVKKTAALSRAVNKFRDVAEGESTAYTLPKDFPKSALKALKDQGYRVSKGKLILPKGQYFRKPSAKRAAQGSTGIRAKPQANRPGGEVVTIPLGPDFEEQIREVFRKKKQGDWIGFQIYGHNSFEIYDSAESMIRALNSYKGFKDGTIKYITIFRTNDPNGYLAQRERDAGNPQRKQRRNLRARERRAMRKGMRVSRGH